MTDFSPLDHEHALLLIKRSQEGDEAATGELVLRNMALVKSIIKKYIGRGVEYDDLYQIGCMGLIKAIRNFDTGFNTHFSTYAVPMIAGEVKRFLRDDGMIKVSRSLRELSIRAASVRERLAIETGKEASVNDIARELLVEPEDVAMALESLRPHMSIYEPMYGDAAEDSSLYVDRVVSNDATEEETIDKVLLETALSSLDDRERGLIMMRFYQEKTQSEIADILGVSQVQVSRLLTKTIKKMRVFVIGL
ncbi:MAG: SigB/SigF/SigG family RNA polymerase sigma factor [Clostridia bacterium]